jgi:hypothetical protein
MLPRSLRISIARKPAGCTTPVQRGKTAGGKSGGRSIIVVLLTLHRAGVVDRLRMKTAPARFASKKPHPIADRPARFEGLKIFCPRARRMDHLGCNRGDVARFEELPTVGVTAAGITKMKQMPWRMSAARGGIPPR